MRKNRKKKTSLVRVEGPREGALAVFDARPDLRDSVQDYANASEAANTVKARRNDWKIFTDWCSRHNVLALPAAPATAAAFLADQSRTEKKAVATVIRYSRSIGAIHRMRNLESPIASEPVRKVLQGIRRERGTQQKRRAAFSADVAAEVLPKYVPRSSQMLARDRAIVLLGLATAFRASELCALDIADLISVPEGLVINLRHSKTDQEGKGRAIAVHKLDDAPDFCPVRAVEEWRAISKATAGPLFCGLRKNGNPSGNRMTENTIYVIVKRVIGAAGLPVKDFGAHSLRAGYVTTARQQGVDWTSIMEQTGHRRLETVKLYTRYTPDVFVATRVADVFRGAFKKKGGE